MWPFDSKIRNRKKFWTPQLGKEETPAEDSFAAFLKFIAKKQKKIGRVGKVILKWKSFWRLVRDFVRQEKTHKDTLIREAQRNIDKLKQESASLESRLKESEARRISAMTEQDKQKKA